MLHKKFAAILCGMFLIGICGCADNNIAEGEENTWLIEPGIYEEIKLLDDNLLAVKDSAGKYGFVDGQGRYLVEGQYFYVLDANEQIVRVMDFDHKVSFVDEEGNPLSEEKFQDAYCFCEGMAAVKENDQWGFINAQGELVIDYRYGDVSEGFREGVAAVEKDGAFYFIDQYGERAFEQEFESASGFSEGLAAVQSDGKWGYIDHSGEFVIDCQYDGAGDFSEEKAAVMKETDGVCKWAYIDSDNEIVIDYQLYGTSEGRMQMVGEFHQGYALVTDELYCLINEQGETVFGNDTYFLTAGGIYDLDTGYLAAYEYTDEAMTEKKYGVINVNGEIIVPFVYENIAEIKGGLAAVTCREENELKTGVLRIDNLPARSEEAVRTRDAEEAVSTFCEMNDTMSELVDRMDEEEGGVSKEELYDSISRYFDESLTDYVCFLYGMIEKEDQLLHDRNYGRQKFVPDTNEEIILLSETENQCELGVTFKHRWERKWAMEAVPVSLEKRENGWIITGISQWYNDFRYHYMRDEIFTPQSFSQQEAEELVKRFALEENADSLKIHTDKEGWILADSSDRLLTNEDVERLSTFEMHMAIQEIYARHGKKFSDAMLEQYFNRQSWYVPYTMMFYAENLSETEEKNIELLAEAGGFQAEETREYGSLYPCSGQEEDELGEEEVAVIIADAFENARKIVEVKEENYLEEKSEGEQKFYSLGEYSEPAKLREYLFQWFGEESIDYILTCLRISNGLELDENGKYCVSTEYTYAGVWQEFDTFTAVEMIGQDENNYTVKAPFINTQVSWVEDAQISSGNIQLAKENDRWIIERMEIPYYDELMIRYA